MIDGSEKRKRQLAFELQSLRVFEKHCKEAWGNCKSDLSIFHNEKSSK